MKTFFIALCLFSWAMGGHAQDSSKKWQATAELDVTSVPALHVSGSDSSYRNQLSLAPTFDFRSPGGFGLTYAPYFLVGGAASGIYMHELTVGLEQYGRKTWDLVADYRHFFFTGNSAIPTTPITNEVLFEAAYKKLPLSPVVSAGIGLGTDKEVTPARFAYDVEVAAGFKHSFDWKKNDQTFDFTPSLLLNAGTNQYFSFLRLSKFVSHSSNFKSIVKNTHASNKAKKRSGTGTTTTSSSQTESLEKLRLDNIELNVESTVEFGSFSISPSGSFYVPLTKQASAGGYWELNISYYF